jgi:hypothetical protein
MGDEANRDDAKKALDISRKVLEKCTQISMNPRKADLAGNSSRNSVVVK